MSDRPKPTEQELRRLIAIVAEQRETYPACSSSEDYHVWRERVAAAQQLIAR
jgi:uncharacterized SAM-binding protein YcdF (DUF218 family)